MTSKLITLDDVEQISDDFTLFYDGEYYYAVRAPTERGDFIIKNKSKWICISDAVSEFQRLNVTTEFKPSIKGRWDNDQKKVVWQ